MGRSGGKEKDEKEMGLYQCVYLLLKMFCYH